VILLLDSAYAESIAGGACARTHARRKHASVKKNQGNHPVLNQYWFNRHAFILINYREYCL